MNLEDYHYKQQELQQRQRARSKTTDSSVSKESSLSSGSNNATGDPMNFRFFFPENSQQQAPKTKKKAEKPEHKVSEFQFFFPHQNMTPEQKAKADRIIKTNGVAFERKGESCWGPC